MSDRKFGRRTDRSIVRQRGNAPVEDWLKRYSRYARRQQLSGSDFPRGHQVYRER